MQFMTIKKTLPGHFKKQFQCKIKYKKSAMLGDTVYPMIYKEKTKDTVTLCTEAGKIYATIEMQWE